MSAEDIVDEVAADAYNEIVARIAREPNNLTPRERRELQWLVVTLVGRRLQSAAREQDTRAVQRPQDARKLLLAAGARRPRRPAHAVLVEPGEPHGNAGKGARSIP